MLGSRFLKEVKTHCIHKGQDDVRTIFVPPDDAFEVMLNRFPIEYIWRLHSSTTCYELQTVTVQTVNVQADVSYECRQNGAAVTLGGVLLMRTNVQMADHDILCHYLVDPLPDLLFSPLHGSTLPSSTMVACTEAECCVSLTRLSPLVGHLVVLVELQRADDFSIVSQEETVYRHPLTTIRPPGTGRGAEDIFSCTMVRL